MATCRGVSLLFNSSEMRRMGGVFFYHRGRGGAQRTQRDWSDKKYDSERQKMSGFQGLDLEQALYLLHANGS